MQKTLILILMIIMFIACDTAPTREYETAKWVYVHDQGLVESFVKDKTVNNINDVRSLISRFVVRTDENCLDVALLGVWGLGELNIPARVVIIGNSKTRETHAICISNDNKYLVSALGVQKLTWNDWRREVLRIYYEYGEVLE